MSDPGTIQIIFDENSDAEVFFPSGDLWSDEPPLESDLHRDRSRT